ncbi:MAG TPA: hypothetical protein VL359_00580, partial [bacterium]|nr:hypothetical protein [bacterium]
PARRITPGGASSIQALRVGWRKDLLVTAWMEGAVRRSIPGPGLKLRRAACAAWLQAPRAPQG